MDADARPHHSAETLLVHAHFLRGLARSLLADEAGADDLVQETWRVAMERPPRHGGNLRAWLATVLRNLARERGRREPRVRGWEARAARPEALPSTAEIAEREATRRDVVQAVLALERPYRDVILLRFYEDLPPRVIARTLDMPVETVRTRLKRGLARLRTVLDERHGGDRATWAALVAPLAFPRRAAAASAWTGPTALKLATAGALVAAGAWWWFADAPTTEPAAPVAAVAAPQDDRGAAGQDATAAQVAALPRLGDDAEGGAGLGAVQPLEAAASEPPFLAAHVRRIAPDGSTLPAEGVQVYAAGLPLEDWSVLLDADGLDHGLLHAIARRTSDAQGLASVDGLPRGAWLVGTAADGDVPFGISALVLVDAPAPVLQAVSSGVELRCRRLGLPVVPVHALPTDGALELPLVAATAPPLDVQVRDATGGTPLPGAEVLHLQPQALALAEAVLGRDRALEILGPLSSHATTDASGRVALPAVGGSGDVLVRADGFEPAQVALASHGDAQTDLARETASGPLEVTLRPGLRVTVEGRLVDQDGAPVADAPVWLTSDVPSFLVTPALRERLDADGRPRTTTDADGRFTFTRVDRLSGSVWSPEALTTDRSVVACAVVDDARPATAAVHPRADDTTQRVELRLVRGGPLEGRVVDAVTGEELRADVLVQRTGAALSESHYLAGMDTFRLGAMPYGPLTLTVRRVGCEPVVFERDWHGEALELPVTFVPVAWSLAVTLVDPSGHLLDRALPAEFTIPGTSVLTGDDMVVRAYDADPTALLTLPSDHPGAGALTPGTLSARRTDDGLRFDFEGGGPDEAWIAVTAAGELLAVHAVPRGTEAVSIAVDPTAVATRLALLTLRTVDRTTGRAVPPGMATLYRPGATGAADALTTFFDLSVNGVVDEPGLYDVRVRAAGYAPVVLRAVALEPGASVERTVEVDPEATLDLEVDGMPATGTGTLRVFDADGRQVLATTLGTGATGSVDGKRTLDGLGAGTHLVRACVGAAAGSTWVEMRPGAVTRAALTLRPAAALRVRLAGAAATGFRGGKLVVLDAEGRRLAQEDLDADDVAELLGDGHLVHVEPGAVRVVLSGPGPGLLERDVQAGATGEVEVTLG